MRNVFLGGLVTVALSAGSAQAAVIDFGLNAFNNVDLGVTHSFIASGDTIIGTAEAGAGHLFGKNGGAGEQGLGTTGDATGEHEIQEGHGYVQIEIDGLIGKVLGAAIQFSTNSVTNNEGWAVYGTNTANATVSGDTIVGGTLVASGHTQTSITLADVGTWKYLDFIAVGTDNTGAPSNFLIADVTATAAAVPEPASLLVLGTSLLGLGMIRRRTN